MKLIMLRTFVRQVAGGGQKNKTQEQEVHRNR